jgi:hypothetical protein
MLKPFPLGSCTFLLSLALINFNLIGFSSGSSRLNKNNLPESQEVSLSSYSHVNNRVTGLESMDNVLADDESNACENAVAETIFRVNILENIEIADIKIWGLEEYRNPPAGKTILFVIVMQGTGVDNMFNSPVLMRSIATSILGACNEVGIVDFSIYQTGHSDRIGWSSNGPIVFSCLNVDEWIRRGSGLINWGQQVCGI